MNTNFIKLHLNSLENTRNFADSFAISLESGLLVCLYGPVGSGKTTFVQFVCQKLGVTENVTSPSFVIINEYKSGKYPVYHFDLYRLEKEGISTVISEFEEYSSNNNAITFIEWADFYQDILSDDRLDIFFHYDEEFSNARLMEISAHGNKPQKLLERLDKILANS